MVLQEDRIVDIKESHKKYFGTAGKMLLPSQVTVAATISKISESQLITTDLLRKEMAKQFKVQGTCPVTTKRALQAIANEAMENIAYWRVIKKNGELMSYYPGGVDRHGAMLIKEGFEIDASGKVPKVKNFRESLVDFG